MMKKSYLDNRIVQAFLLIFPLSLFVFFVGEELAFSRSEEVEKVEKQLVNQKKLEKEREKALIQHFYSEGERLFEEENYEDAVEYFSRILEIDPNHRGAKNSLKKINETLRKERKLTAPDEMARRLLKSGRVKYGKRDYDGAIQDFQDALALDYTNDDIIEWLKRTRHRESLEESKDSVDDVLLETKAMTKKKELEEKTAMLEIEKAYLPPERSERRPIEIEEIISAEQEQEERAREELMKKLKEKMVPAVSLTEADIRDVIRQLMEITGVTIIIDEKALAQATGEEPLKITFSTVTPVPLLEVLDIALRATELAYRVEPNYIWISTPEKLEKEELVTKTYRLKYGVRRIRKVQLKEFETTSGGTE